MEDRKGRTQPSKWRDREARISLNGISSLSEFQGANANYRRRGTTGGRERKESFLEAEAANLLHVSYTTDSRQFVPSESIRAELARTSYDKREQFRLSVSHVSIAIVMSEGRIMPRSTTQFIRGP